MMPTSVENAMVASLVGTENKFPFVEAPSLDDAGHPLHVKLTTVGGFSFAEIADWSQASLPVVVI